jgi:cell fate (sporulation/competence/biofilm development) regulator YmcA (YheA/YmcA/DUF963 family)
MTNEERIEEIIFEAHKLGIKDSLFDLVKVLSKDIKTKERVEIYETALRAIKNNKKIDKNG